MHDGGDDVADQDDTGTGGSADGGSGWAGLTAIGGAAVAAARGARDLYTELSSLQGFKNRVDELLKDLGDSEAAPVRMADHRLPGTHLGSGFAEAEGLHKVYAEVHDELTALSELLSGQIEAMSTAVHAARVGYENIDLDNRERMWQIHDFTDRYYRREQGGGAGSPGSGGDRPGAAQQADTHRPPGAGDDSAGAGY
ncbi:hypothetical protein KBZ10_28750 [Streptomyces sp. F63]|uniref:hypothetical protein n=1 Tax=Streptomyces sp. F63 TaxID=2824887 RepID=UPI001B368824|nr:hypothetical protein [Streptomyces sp. F63]MBQ0988426.1 hypothetical protein [Streptomyces sp. F63]